MTDSNKPNSRFDPKQHATAMANTLQLPIDPAWEEAIVANLVVLEAAAQLVLDHPLRDDSESALTFKAGDDPT